MKEKRQAKRVSFDGWVKEVSGDYYRLFKAINISEGGIFLSGKIITQDGLAEENQYIINIPGKT